tara:strand:- start:3063 stop:5045 length:1983 start_codon:yes stop_codon:yes gene_type:complete
MNTVRYQLSQDQYLSDIHIDLDNQDYITHISADTGVGKSSWVMDKLGKQHNVVFAVPQLAQMTQLEAKHAGRKGVSFYYGGHLDDEPTGIIVCLYNQIDYVLSLVFAHQYLLVIDEVHKIYQASSYRGDHIASLLDVIDQERFSGVVTMSATFTPELVPFTIDSWIDINKGQSVTRAIDLDIYLNLDAMEDGLIDVLTAPRSYPTVVRINNKAEIQVYQRLLEAKGLTCLAVSRNAQGTDAVQEMLTAELVAGYDVILTTSLLDEAVNLNDQHIHDVVVYNSQIHPEELKQFIGRFRCCNPPIRILIPRRCFGGDPVNLEQARQNDLALVRSAQQLAERMLDKHDAMQAVRKINETMFELFQLYPLRICRSQIVANEPEVMAHLYQLDTQQHYLNADSLEAGFRRELGALSFNVTDLTLDADESNDAFFEAAHGSVNDTWYRALHGCKQAVDSAVLELAEQDGQSVDVLAVIDDVRATYDSNSLEADLLNRWTLLHREVLVNSDDAFDVIEQGHEKQVWAFHREAEGNIYLQPVLKHLMTVPKGTRLTLTEARRLILAGLQKASKNHPAFKDLVAMAKVTGLTVKKNNHFSVTDSYVRKVFRRYTATPPDRSNNKDKIVFNGVGPFGYQYKLRDLRTGSVKSGRSRIRRLKQHLTNSNAA